MRTSLIHRKICVKKADPQYRWAYLVTRYQDSYAHKTMQKFISIVRCGVPQSDWVAGTIWGSKVIKTGPPCI